jgi:hypothetical protein
MSITYMSDTNVFDDVRPEYVKPKRPSFSAVPIRESVDSLDFQPTQYSLTRTSNNRLVMGLDFGTTFTGM